MTHYAETGGLSGVDEGEACAVLTMVSKAAGVPSDPRRVCTRELRVPALVHTVRVCV